MLGRAISQQGLATTCKDCAHNGHTGGAGREMVWRMSPYERRRGGNAPPGGLRGRPGAGNARFGQRGSGHSVASTAGYAPDSEPGYAGPASWRRGDANSTASGRRVRQHRSFALWGKVRPEKWVQSRGQNRTREIRPSGIVEGLQETWPVEHDLHAARAPDFYLDPGALNAHAGICAGGGPSPQAKARPYRDRTCEGLWRHFASVPRPSDGTLSESTAFATRSVRQSSRR